MRIVLILARILVLLVALFGAGWAAVSGSLFYAAVTLNDNPPPNSDATLLSPEDREGTIKSTPFLFAGALLALIGGILAVCGYPGNGGVWLLVAAVGPVLLFPNALCGSIGLFGAAGLSLLAWLLSLFVKPKPEAATA